MQGAQVVATQGHVMQEIPGTVPIVRVHPGQVRLRRGEAGGHVRPDGHEFVQCTFDFRVAAAHVVGAVLLDHKRPLLNDGCVAGTLRIEAVGRNPDSSGYYAGIDAVMLAPQQ